MAGPELKPERAHLVLQQRAVDTLESARRRLLVPLVAVVAALLLGGGALFLAGHGMGLPEWRLFHGQPRTLETPWGILRAALAGQARALMDLGLLVLVAGPPLQLLLASTLFQRFGDHLYSALSLAVLALLLAGFSLGW